MRIVPILACLLAPVPALADCPTRLDLRTGIRMTSDLGETETVVLNEDGTQMVRFLDKDGNGVQMRLARGIYLLHSADIENGRTALLPSLIVTYPVDIADLPDPVPGQGYSATVKLGGAGFDGATERQEFTFGDPRPHRIGDCEYTMIPITATYVGPDDSFQDVYFYLTELGLSYLGESGPIGEAPEILTNHIRIEAVE